jgi:hypothetical protein
MKSLKREIECSWYWGTLMTDEKPINKFFSCRRRGRDVSDSEGAHEVHAQRNFYHVRQLLNKERKLKGVQGYDAVYNSPSLPADQRNRELF